MKRSPSCLRVLLPLLCIGLSTLWGCSCPPPLPPIRACGSLSFGDDPGARVRDVAWVWSGSVECGHFYTRWLDAERVQVGLAEELNGTWGLRRPTLIRFSPDARALPSSPIPMFGRTYISARSPETWTWVFRADDAPQRAKLLFGAREVLDTPLSYAPRPGPNAPPASESPPSAQSAF